MMFDLDALDQAFYEVSKKEMQKKVHEWIIYTAPPEILAIYKRYLEITEENEINIDE
jgi:hypothetical protein